MTTKNDHIGFRLPMNLRKDLHEIAKNEGRTLSQICEMIVYGGLETYKKEGSRYLQSLLQQQKKPSAE
jgi:predicted DNA-binding protein